MAGIGDVRDGITVQGLALASKQYASEGGSIGEVLSNVKAVVPAPVLDELILALPRLMGDVIELTGMDDEHCVKVEGVVSIYVGVGVTAGVFLGWVDTTGYRMIGVQGSVAAVFALSVTLECGVHEDGRSVRVVLYGPKVGVDLMLHLDRPLQQATSTSEGPPAAAED
ncbi:hypothetical protein T492DRAFT_1059903 [Pavlovales sp. CCMP2436]|nr:hypothetical protein T492DRAFT_1059903 [Pavlovales sp. CCMP2436]|mmetsp:Transcript_43130/g.106498  ORF Transcript_43130/g.106498 Transcript_43130/m.106498 type:complete len:168 (-) Transcript_43130:174-677(-)